MILLIVLLFCIAAIITGVFSVYGGWVIIAIPIAYLLITLIAVKKYKWEHVPELSGMANEMLRKYGHYYNMPSAGNNYSSSASILGIAGVILAIVGAFKGFWWGIGLSLVNWFIIGLIAKAFNPTLFLVGLREKKAHEEIISYILERQEANNEIT